MSYSSNDGHGMWMAEGPKKSCVEVRRLMGFGFAVQVVASKLDLGLRFRVSAFKVNLRVWGSLQALAFYSCAGHFVTRGVLPCNCSGHCVRRCLTNYRCLEHVKADVHVSYNQFLGYQRTIKG